MNTIKILSGFSMRKKLILSFCIFIVIVSILISVVSMSIFTFKLEGKNNRYISDINYQTVNNVEMNLRDLEEITFSVLSSSTVQDSLKILNDKRLKSNDLLPTIENMEKALNIYTLYNDAIISLSVFSDSNIEIVSRSVQLEQTKTLFSKKEIYAANGSAIWGLIRDEGNEICLARAILDLNTQKPIGYINLVFRKEYIGDIMNDITFSYVSGSYIVDKDSIVISSNKEEMLGEKLKLPDINNESSGSYKMKVEGVPSYIFKGEQMYNGWTVVTIIPQNELSRETAWFVTVIILLDITVILIAVGTIWALVKKLTSPLDRLCKNMEQVGHGNFEKTELIETNDEIGLLSSIYNEMVDNIKTLIDQVYKLEIAKRQAELEFLKMQINPHFLYNTLDTISWMARIENNNDIADVTIALASLLRATIKQNDFITIAEEIKNIQNYLVIQNYRFGSKCTSVVLVEKECEGFFIPSFILQPLVENAIVHGLEPKQSKGKLIISVKKEDGVINCIVADDGVGMEKDVLQEIIRDMNNESTKSFIGLKNVDKRLRLFYGEESALHLESDVSIGTRISFKISENKELFEQEHNLKLKG